jgi:hypothetical protein
MCISISPRLGVMLDEEMSHFKSSSALTASSSSSNHVLSTT